MDLEFKSNSPCNNCPYRKDAPLKLWHKSEYEKLERSESDNWGCVYGCHKNNGSVCVGWLMNQERRNFPSLALRLKMIKQNITKEFLDSLHCVSEMYASVKDMIQANYPSTKFDHDPVTESDFRKYFRLKKTKPRGFKLMSEEKHVDASRKGGLARSKKNKS